MRRRASFGALWIHRVFPLHCSLNLWGAEHSTVSLLGCYHRGEIRNPVIYKKQNVCDNTTGSQSIPEVIAGNKGEWVIPNWQGLISNW